MKKLIIAFRFILATSAAATAYAGNGADNVLYIKSSKLASPLVERWITEYAKVNPAVQFRLADQSVTPDNVSLSLVLSGKNTGENGAANAHTVYFGEYAILPITAKESAASQELSKKKLNGKRLKELFFEKNILSEDAGDAEPQQPFTVYSGSGKTSLSEAFASWFGYTPSSLRGKHISGDDIFLNTAISKDRTGVSFNALSNIFDVKSRKLKENITILPLDVKKEFAASLSEAATVDDAIRLLETENIDLVPTGKIGFACRSGEAAVHDFLVWVLTRGKAFNHEYGILNLNERTLAAQIEQVRKGDTASSSLLTKLISDIQ
ncbi:MAG: hypothetical protein LBF17_00090 [Mediterranea sp.]|nr:hypothetical protein [Mediterranea sp.]